MEAIILDVAELGVPNKDGKNEKGVILGGKTVKMPGSRGQCVANRASSTDMCERAEGSGKLYISGSLRKVLMTIACNRPTCD
jgi:hypothetical protein